MKIRNIKGCYHPLLIALWPILFLYAHNIDQVPIVQIVLPSSVTLGCAALIWFLLNLIVRNLTRSALIVSASLFLFFLYGHLYSLIENFGFRAAGVNIGPNKIIYLLFGILFVISIYFSLKVRKSLPRITALLNWISVVFVLLSVARIVIYYAGPGSDVRKITSDETIASANGAIPGKDNPPDIYYIILDAYARQDVLRELYDYDNSWFLENLRDKGFYVASRSRANYPMTVLSMAATLNMKYLDGLLDPAQIGHGLAIALWNNSSVVKYLKRRGYLYVVLNSGILDNYYVDADIELRSPFTINDFLNQYINTTPLGPFLHKFYSQYKMHRNSVLYVFDQLSDMSRFPSPKFVLAHIMIPHQPFVFNSQGEPVQPTRPYNSWGTFLELDRDEQKRNEYLAGYRDQLAFTSRKTIELMDEIIANSTQPPIIILQADHGPAAYLAPYSLEQTNLEERLSILNAYYLPGGGDKQLYEAITPVNTFRLILNHYFGADYEILPDRSYFSTWDRPYLYMDVTDKLTEQSAENNNGSEEKID